MANTSWSLNIHCIFSAKEHAPMLNPELKERLWHSWAELPNKTVSRPDAATILSLSQLSQKEAIY